MIYIQNYTNYEFCSFIHKSAVPQLFELFELLEFLQYEMEIVCSVIVVG